MNKLGYFAVCVQRCLKKKISRFVPKLLTAGMRSPNRWSLDPIF